jgi:glycosyltransferase involved in cell wall biosynthesis
MPAAKDSTPSMDHPQPSRPLDVLHVIDSIGHGGAEQNLLSVIRRMEPQRYRHHLAWLYSEHQLLEAFRPHVATLLPLAARPRLGLLHAAARLGDWIRHHRPDVVHAQLLRAHLVARLAATVGGRLPVVTTWQNAIYEDSMLGDFRGSPLFRAAVRQLDRATARFDRHFIAVSEHVARHWTQAMGVPPTRVSVIFNAVEPERYGTVPPSEIARTRDELGLGPGARVILSVGRLIPTKGHADAIAAMPAVLARHPDAILLIAGRGPLEAELRAQVEAVGLAGRVKILGARGDVPCLCQLADVFLFPTRSEGLSVALVEVLANGLPSAISDIAPNREVADGLRSVRFFPVGDVAQIAACVSELFDGGEAVRRLAEAAKTGLRARFDPARLARQIGETLERAAGWEPQLNGSAGRGQRIVLG